MCRKDTQLLWEPKFSVSKAFCVILRQQTFREETQEKHIIIKKKILGTLVRNTRVYHTSHAKFFLYGQKLQNYFSTFILIIISNVHPKGFSNFILNCTCRFCSERGTFLQLPIKEIMCSNARTFSQEWNMLFISGNLWIFFECLMIVEQDGYEGIEMWKQANPVLYDYEYLKRAHFY